MKTLARAAIALVATLALLELALRAASGFFSLGEVQLSDPSRQRSGERFVYDAQLGWRNLPNSAADSYGHPVHINSHGLRDREYPFAKPAGHYRILVLSDSFGWGFAVGDDQVFTEILERRASADSSVEVINASVSGWGPDQQLLFFETEGWKYRPDVVVFSVFTLNDYENVRSSHQYGLEKPYLWFDRDGRSEVRNVPVPLAARASAGVGVPQLAQPLGILYRSRIYRALFAAALTRPTLLSALEGVGLVHRSAPDPDALPEILAGRALPAIGLRAHTLAHIARVQPQRLAAKPPRAGLDPELEAALPDLADHMRDVIERMRVACDAAGSKLVVMTHGAFLFWDPPLVRQLEALLAQRLAQLDGVHHFDLDAAFRAAGIAPDALLAGGVDSHWGPTGHRLAAALLEKDLRANGLLPKAAAASATPAR